MLLECGDNAAAADDGGHHGQLVKVITNGLLLELKDHAFYDDRRHSHYSYQEMKENAHVLLLEWKNRVYYSDADEEGGHFY